ncbi:hypothetical protein MLD52_20935 [Puniceicoccaceae bacterium K14]|nr:hypothetical protein [Puniceicoccaceae bacterium K14]
MSEVLIYERALGEQERVDLEASLADKYGIYHPDATWIVDFDAASQGIIHAGQLDRNEFAETYGAYAIDADWINSYSSTHQTYIHENTLDLVDVPLMPGPLRSDLGFGNGLLLFTPLKTGAFDLSPQNWSITGNLDTSYPDRFGSANSSARFDTEHLVVEAGLSQLDEVTVSVWAKPEILDGTEMTLVGDYDGSVPYDDETFSLRTHTSTSFGFYAIGEDSTSMDSSVSNSITLGEWHHVVGHFGDSYLGTRVNSVDGNLGSHSTSLNKVNRLLGIGAEYSGERKFKGQINDVMIWDRALSSEELELLYFVQLDFDRSLELEGMLGHATVAPSIGAWNYDGEPVEAGDIIPVSGIWRVDLDVAINIKSVSLYLDDVYVADFTRVDADSYELLNTLAVDAGTYDVKVVATNFDNVSDEVSEFLQLNINQAPPMIEEIALDGNELINGSVLLDGVTLSATASDENGVGSIEFRLIDDQASETLLHEELFVGAIVNPEATQFGIDAIDYDDTDYTLKVVVTDRSGAASEELRTISFDISAPVAPTISEPGADSINKSQTVTVSGGALRADTVRIYEGATLIGIAPVSVDGSYSIQITLDDGAYAISAIATNRGGDSAQSSQRSFEVNSQFPPSPINLTVTAEEGGDLSVTWDEPSFTLAISGYRVYRRISGTSDWNLISGNDPTSATSYLDEDTADGTSYEYRVDSVVVFSDQSERASDGAESIPEVADSASPSFSIRVASAENEYVENDETHYGVGFLTLELVSTEPLSNIPYLGYTRGVGVPEQISLRSVGSNTYEGTFIIDSSVPSGTYVAQVRANDLSGNLGETVTSGSELIIDTSAPSVASLSNSPSTIENVLNNGTGSVQQFTITLDEAPASTPIARILLPDSSISQNAIVSDAGDSDPLTWYIEYNLPIEAGVPEEEIIELVLEASDALGNSSVDVSVISYLVYQGELPALPSPDNLEAVAMADGAIQLSWDSVEEAYGYGVYVEPVNDPGNVQSVSTLIGIDNTSLNHTPTVDGEYLYYVSSIRDVNGEQAESVYASFAVVVSDRESPSTPTLVSLLSTANGVDILWDRPVGSLAESITYELYRSSSSDFSNLATATLIRSDFDDLSFKDSSPNSGQPYYAVLAVDSAGNISPISNALFLNVALLPVNDLSITLEEGTAPVLQWSSVSAATGYNVYRGEEGSESLLNVDGPITDLTWSDLSFAGGPTRYAIESVIEEPGDTYYSLRRGLTLPVIDLASQVELELGIDFPSKLSFDLEFEGSDVSSYWGSLQLMDPQDEVIGQTMSNDLPSDETNLLEVTTSIDEASAEEIESLDVLAVVTLETPTAEAIVYTKGFDTSLVIGSIVSQVEILGEVIRGTDCQLIFSVENTSEVPIDFVVAEGQSNPSTEARVIVSDSNDTIYVNSPIRLVNNITQVVGTDQRVARVQAGDRYETEEISVSLPANLPPVVTISVVVDNFYYALASVSEITISGSSAEAVVSTIEPSYKAEINSISPTTTNGEDPITISGQALREVNGVVIAQPTVPVVIAVRKGESIRRFEAYTDSSGNYSFEYTPYSDDAGGVYEAWVHHPEVTAEPEADALVAFTLQRLELLSSGFTSQSLELLTRGITIKIPRLYEQDFSVNLNVPSNLQFNNLRLEVHPESLLSPDVSLTLPTPLTVTAEGVIELPVTFSGLEPAILSDSSFRLQVVSDEVSGSQNLGEVTVNYSFSAPYRLLSAQGSLSELGVGLEEDQSSQIVAATDDLSSVAIVNTGLLPLSDLSLELLQLSDASPAPAWISIAGSDTVESLYVGDQINLVVQTNVEGLLGTPSVPAPGEYQLFIRMSVEEEQDPLLELPVTVTVTESGENSRSFRVMNAFFNYDEDLLDGRDPTTSENPYFNGMSGARVSLEAVALGSEGNSWIPPEEIALTSDAEGRVSFVDLPTGEYKLRVEAGGHDSHSSRIFVKPGIAYAEEVIGINYRSVSVSWEVVPITIEDRYDIFVETTFETDVPAPVIVIEPAVLEIPDLCPGDVFTAELSLRNEGLVTASNIANPLLDPDPYLDIEILSDTPEVFDIPAGREVRIVFRMTCVLPLPGSDCDTEEN